MQTKLEKYLKNFGYTLDYLSSGSPIFQLPSLYTFSSDSVALAHFVKEKQIETLVDLCSGSGVVGLEIVDTIEVKNLYMVELQEELSLMSGRSAEFSKTNTTITALNCNVVGVSDKLPPADVVVVNPPYFKVGSGDVPKNTSRAMARHELTLSLPELIIEASKILKPSGKLYMVHLNSRFNEIKKLLSNHNFNLVSNKTMSGKLERVLIEAVKL